ncbi:Type I phosphatidylinositol 4,5-bisphosphate 4-phosphatase-A [Takifugu flavidus]|uniref:Phosphatidylinositol-4,5-bisphosphate 4-phosphatase n=1 Tax=Takifugu flavidus TaxID=433684 RepID=A0A5C6P571_9TELE|nr:Type I phosphatidylinositol 4,5-bisphosphate 4-phosphatase-A [Takifugu flavidus]
MRREAGSLREEQAGTWGNARTYPGIYASWAALLLLVLISLARALYWACMRVSQPLQNFT